MRARFEFHMILLVPLIFLILFASIQYAEAAGLDYKQMRQQIACRLSESLKDTNSDQVETYLKLCEKRVSANSNQYEMADCYELMYLSLRNCPATSRVAVAELNWELISTHG